VAAYAMCDSIDPSGWEYDTSVMVAIIDNNLSTNSVDMLPPDVIMHARRRKTTLHMSRAVGDN